MRRRHGFTLIELLIVVLIIGVLAAIAIPKFTSVKQKGYKAQGIGDLTSLRTAEESFYADSNRYGTLAELAWRWSPTSGVGRPDVVLLQGAWSATLTHPHIPGLVCGVGVGTPNPVDAAAGEGEAFCK